MTLGLLCVHPHPDDESIFAGGAIARYVDEGHRVKVVTCTRGEAGDNLGGIDLGGRPIEAARQGEMRRALEALGQPEHEYLGYRDSGMAGTADNDHPDSFHRADLDQAAGRLAGIIRTFRPDVVVSDDHRGTYGHPDHVKANLVTVAAVERAADPGWGSGEPWTVAKRYVVAYPRGYAFRLHRALVNGGLASPFGGEDARTPADLAFGTPDHDVTTIIDVRAWVDRKLQAIAAHESQIGDDSFFFNLPASMPSDVHAKEYFVLQAPIRPSTPEVDLFAGLWGRS